MLTHRVNMNSGSVSLTELTRATEVKIKASPGIQDTVPGEINSITPDSNTFAVEIGGEKDADNHASHISQEQPNLVPLSDVVVGVPLVKTFESCDTTFRINISKAA